LKKKTEKDGKKLFSWNSRQKGPLQNGLATKSATPKRVTTKRVEPKRRASYAPMTSVKEHYKKKLAAYS